MYPRRGVRFGCSWGRSLSLCGADGSTATLASLSWLVLTDAVGGGSFLFARKALKSSVLCEPRPLVKTAVVSCVTGTKVAFIPRGLAVKHAPAAAGSELLAVELPLPRSETEFELLQVIHCRDISDPRPGNDSFLMAFQTCLDRALVLSFGAANVPISTAFGHHAVVHRHC